MVFGLVMKAQVALSLTAEQHSLNAVDMSRIGSSAFSF